MMTLSTMQMVVSTVDDQWESPLADEILQHWANDGAPAKYWRASSNFVFFFKHAAQDHVLRFTHESERTVEAIQAEMDYVNQLADKGILVARPIRSLNGNHVESIDTDYGLFHAVVFEALKGEQREIEDFTPEQFVRWGQALGDLHNATAELSIGGRPTWEEHLAMVADLLPDDEVDALRTLEMVKARLSKLSVRDDNFGLIHYDFEPDNIIWRGDQPEREQAGIIDFDDSAYYWFVADIALALGELFEDTREQVDLQNESFLHFVEGYRTVRSIADEELALIPLFIQANNLVTFAKLHRALTPVNPAGELPWMPALRDKLTAKMAFYRDEMRTATD